MKRGQRRCAAVCVRAEGHAGPHFARGSVQPWEEGKPVNAGATPLVQGATESAQDSSSSSAASETAPLEPERDGLHTGDDDLLDALTGIRAGLDELLEGEHGTMSAEQHETLGDIYEGLNRADELRVAELLALPPREAVVSPQGWREFNINDHVWVKLTPKGKAMVREQDARWSQLYATSFGRLPTAEKQEADYGGWSRWQLWSLIEAFGSALYLGCDPPFETTIGFGPAPPSAVSPRTTTDE